MSKRESFLLKIWRKLRRQRPQAARERVRAKLPRVPVSTLEPLEGRIAPAAVINPMTITFTDLDGDLVTVKLTKAFGATGSDLTTAASAIFKFADASGNTSPFGDSGPQQLQLINLQSAGTVGGVSVMNGTSITVTATPVTGSITPGNDVTTVGAIQAGGIALGAVSIDGDLGQIDAGGSSSTTAIKSLSAKSIGAATTITQLGVPSFESLIVGGLGSLSVEGETNGFVHVVNRVDSFNQIRAAGNIGKINIGGSLAGVVDPTSGLLGSVQADANIGAVKIGGSLSGGGGDLSGSLVALNGKIASISIGGYGTPGGVTGGDGQNSGIIYAGASIGAVTITGDLTGGSKTATGSIRAGTNLGAVKILGDITGGVGSNSGWINAGGNIASITLGDSTADDLKGGTGTSSGLISAGGTVGAVKIAGNVVGDGLSSGGITAGGKLTSVTIGGSLFGGLNTDGTSDGSGVIAASGDLGTVKIGGDMKGGGGAYSGMINATGKFSSLTIGGQLVGGVGANSGVVFSSTNPDVAHDFGKLVISQGIVGGRGPNSGSVIADGRLLNVTVGSVPPASAGAATVAVQGGTNTFSGSILSHFSIGTVKITGDLVGGSAANSGSIQAVGNLANVTVLGSLHGSAGDFSGTILSQDERTADGPKPGNIGRISVTGTIGGGSGYHAGAIDAQGNIASATVGSISAGGTIFAGSSLENAGSAKLINVLGGFAGGGIEVDGTLTTLKVKGDVTGSAVRAADSIRSLTVGGNLDDSLISARGQAVASRSADVAIGSLTIGGRAETTGNVSGSQILAGYDLDGVAVNPHAQIGSVKVTHDWTASSLIAGIVDANSDGFGGGDDELIPLVEGDTSTVISKIASITIGGTVSGTPEGVNPNDTFGFEAQQIGKFKSAAGSLALTALPGQSFTLDSDTFLREIEAVLATGSNGVTKTGAGTLSLSGNSPGEGTIITDGSILNLGGGTPPSLILPNAVTPTTGIITTPAVGSTVISPTEIPNLTLPVDSDDEPR